MSENELKCNYIISNKYKDLLNKNINQKIVLDIINSSRVVFPGLYKEIVEQSNNESDYVSSLGINYDFKILFKEEQCQVLAFRNGSLVDFMNIVCAETSDIYDSFIGNNSTKIDETILYKEIKRRLKLSKENEIIILFIPFPLTLEFKDSLSTIIEGDIFLFLWDFIVKNEPELVKKNEVFIIYPCLDNSILLRNLSDGTKGFLDLDVLKNIYYQRLKFATNYF